MTVHNRNYDNIESRTGASWFAVFGRAALFAALLASLAFALRLDDGKVPSASVGTPSASVGTPNASVGTQGASAGTQTAGAGAQNAGNGVLGAVAGAPADVSEPGAAAGADAWPELEPEPEAPRAEFVPPKTRDGVKPIITYLKSAGSSGSISAAPGGNPATSGILHAQPNFQPLDAFFAAAGDLTEGVAEAHKELLEKRLGSITYARQISAAKFLSVSEYETELAWRAAFVEKNGAPGDQLGEDDISRLYSKDYFTERLNELGFYKNDKYGADVNRRNAIIRAQSHFNIPITAKIDLTTKRALIEGTDYTPRDVLTGEHPEGLWVVIDKSARILTVYVGDEVFLKYPVAVGSNIGLTPEGQFTFVIKAKNPRWGGGGYASPIAGGAPNNPLGKRWMGLSKGGGGSYGVHGNVSPYSIGTNASHGCVRMINSDVEELYEYIEVGTPVWVGTTSKLQEWGVYQLLGCWAPKPPNFWDYMPDNT